MNNNSIWALLGIALYIGSCFFFYSAGKTVGGTETLIKTRIAIYGS